MSFYVDIADRMKKVDDQTKLILFGFIRESQLELTDTHQQCAFYIIPDIITCTCLLFYYLDEYFAKCNVAEVIISGKNNETITKRNERFVSSSWDNTSYGNLWIDSNENKVIIWTLKINKSSGDDICIGIVPTDHDISDDFTVQCANNYSFCINGAFFDNKIHYNKDSIRCKQGDTIQFILDLIDSKLRLNVIGKQSGGLLSNTIRKAPNIKYKLAISLHYHNDSVTLINYDEQTK